MAESEVPAELPERRFTERLAAFFPRDDRLLVGIGDDAAVLRRGDGDLVLCCDPVVEGRHFRSGQSLAAVGRKAVDRNLSDLAAMGGTPEAVLVSVLFPEHLAESERWELFEGLRDAAGRVSALVVGGDVGSTDGPLTVTVSLIGRVSGAPSSRAGAAVGNQLFVTGPLGGAGFEDPKAEGDLPRHLRLQPRLEAGRACASDPQVRAAIDLSDGLVIDLWTLCRASRVPGAELDAQAIPIHSDARSIAARSGHPALDHALFDGEDHELLVARSADEESDPAVLPFAVGRLIDQEGIWLRDADGSRRRLPLRGFQHR